MNPFDGRGKAIPAIIEALKPVGAFSVLVSHLGAFGPRVTLVYRAERINARGTLLQARWNAYPADIWEQLESARPAAR